VRIGLARLKNLVQYSAIQNGRSRALAGITEDVRGMKGRGPEIAEPSHSTVRSVARALTLVEAVSRGPADGLTLGEAAEAIGSSKSTALALARTLVRFQYLRRTKPGPRYVLGTALIRLGDRASQQLPLGELCRPALMDLREATGMTARVALSEEGHPVFIERVDGPGGIRFHTPLGQREFAHATAAGKAILATMTDDEVRGSLGEDALQRRTSRTITNIDTLLAELAIARRRGYAVDDEEDADGVLCVGAAIFDHNDRCLGALSVTGIKLDLPGWRIDEIGQTVRRHAEGITALLAGAPVDLPAPGAGNA
jgi:IclR family acetate operon transcriptional repressor